MPLSQKEIDEQRRQWWARWFGKDYSWDGLAKLNDEGTPDKPWIGWSVTPDNMIVETDGAPEGSRPATLQDYFRWDADAKRLRDDEELTGLNLLHDEHGRPRFHILHLPERWLDDTPTWKNKPTHHLWETLETEVGRFLARGAKTEFDGFKVNGHDNRAQFQGAVLQAFPRPDRQKRTEVSNSGDAATAPIPLHVTFYRAAFLSDCDANEIQFGSAASFNRATFLGDARFDNAQFSGGYADFFFARFSGGYADFSYTQFSGGDALFTKTQFSGGEARFSYAQFSGGEASFQLAQFTGGDAGFNNARFSGGYADFSYAQFSGGDALFFYAEFSGGDAWFEHAQFSGGNVSLYRAQFSGGNVSFHRAEFSGGDARFDNAQFSGGNASFQNARFQFAFSAVETEFQNDTNFIGTEFEAPVKFGVARQPKLPELNVHEGAHFCGPTTFRGATFKSIADFSRCTFPEKAADRNAAFEGTRFVDSLDLKGVKNLPFSAFQGAILDTGVLIGPEHPVEAQFQQALGEAEDAILEDQKITDAEGYDPEKDADALIRGADSRFASLEGGCRTLKHAMAQVADRQREQKFYRMELIARSRRPSVNFGERLAAKAYGVFADFGGSILRPLAWLVAVTLIATAIYISASASWILVNPQSGLEIAFGWGLEPHPIVYDSAELALQNALGPLRFVVGSGNPFEDVGRSYPLLRLFMGLISAFQALISLVLLFLTALALRRQFQIN